MNKRYLRWARDALFLILVIVVVQWWQTRDMPRGQAPGLQGPGLQGGLLSLAELRGQPVLVHFWATWCPVCRLEAGSIADIAADHAVLTVATTSGTADEVNAYLVENDLDMPVIIDQTGKLAGDWSIRGVPASFVIDSRGQIAFATSGYSSETGLRLRLLLAD